MKIAISAPTGYNCREILLPLRDELTADNSLTEVHVITPAAPWREALFPTFGDKFIWHANPGSLADHIALWETISPQVVLTPTVGLDTKDTFLLRAANQLGIPTVTFIASWDNVFKMARRAPRDHAIPKFIAVWNQMNYDHVAAIYNKDIDQSHMVITGPPRFDYFSHTDRIPSKEQLFSYLGFAREAQNVPLLHCATTELYPFGYIIKSLRHAVRAGLVSPPPILYASVHPGGNIKKHQHYTKYNARVKYSFGRRDPTLHPDFAYLPTDQETYLLIALFKHTSILINQSSTVAIESMAADVPIINVAYGRSFDFLGWRRSGVYRDFKQHYRYIISGHATALVHNKQELIAAVQTYLAAPTLHHAQRQATLKSLITYTDGGNSRRLLNFVKQCAA